MFFLFFFPPHPHPPLFHDVWGNRYGLAGSIFSCFWLCLFLYFTFGALYDVVGGVWFRISLIFSVGGYLDVFFCDWSGVWGNLLTMYIFVTHELYYPDV